MKILFSHRYFWPDTAPYAVLLRSISVHIAQHGHEVSVFSSMPSYRGAQSGTPKIESLDGVKVFRTRVLDEAKRNPFVRLLNVFLYITSLFIFILRHKPDVVTAGSFPPVIAAWMASLAAKWVGAKFIYHCQDIHPDVSYYSGGFLGRPVPRAILLWLDNQTLRRSHRIVVLSQDMADTLESRGVPDLPIHIINNFLLESFEAEVQPPEEYTKASGNIRAIFAGNLGRFQNLEALTDGIAACFPLHPELELMFLGDGTALGNLKAKWDSHPQVRFAPFMPFSQAQALIKNADIGLVSLQPNIYKVAYPSKALSYLGLGLPIFAMVEEESELSKMLEHNGLGCSSGGEISKSFRTLLSSLPKATTIRSHYTTNLSTSVVLKAWDRLFDE